MQLEYDQRKPLCAVIAARSGACSENGGSRRVGAGGGRRVGVASPMGQIRKWRHPKSRRRKSNGANQKMAASAEWCRKSNGANQKMAASAEWCRKSNGANQKMAASEKSVSQVQWGESENGGVRNVGVASPMGRIRKCGVRKVGVASPVGRNRKWRHPQSRCRKSNGAKQKMAACAELVSQLIILPGHC
jgi:hypothetical protein